MEGIKSRNRALFISLTHSLALAVAAPLHHVVDVNFSSVLRQNCHSGNVTQSTNIKFTHRVLQNDLVLGRAPEVLPL